MAEMKLIRIPPGRFLVQFAPRQKETSGGLIIPGTVRSIRQDETAAVIMKGDATPRNGQMYDIPIAPGELVWVHPQFGDQWKPETEISGEMRSYDFYDYRGTVEPAEEAR